MIDFLVEQFSALPAGWEQYFSPQRRLGELRLAIPVAIQVWEVPAIDAYGLAVLGNMIPFVFLFFGLDYLRDLSERFVPKLTKYIDNHIERSKKKVQKKYARYGALALFLFTAIPLPLTGLWTATIAAVALKVPLRYALFGIVCGVLVSGIIVTTVTMGVTEVF